MRKPKAHNVLLEDRTWVKLSKLGWRWMNKDRSFRLCHSKNKDDKGKQVDVFAADDETAIIVECKSAEVHRKDPPSFAQDIYEISDLRKGVNDNLRKAFEQSQRPRGCLSRVTTESVKRIKTALNSETFFIFLKMNSRTTSSLLRTLARWRNTSCLVVCSRDRDIPELDTRVPALRAKTAGRIIYSS